MSLECYIEEALRLLHSSQHRVAICRYKKNYQPTPEEIALLWQLHDAYRNTGCYTERVVQLIQIRTLPYKEEKQNN